MTPLDLARAFLEKGREDESTLEIGAEDPRMSDAIFAFHAQQAAEKYLKAVLAIDQERPERTHDLRILAEQCAQAGHPILEDRLGAVGDLSRYAVQDRYPLALTPPIDRAETLGLVVAVRAWAEDVIDEAS